MNHLNAQVKERAEQDMPHEPQPFLRSGNMVDEELKEKT